MLAGLHRLRWRDPRSHARSGLPLLRRGEDPSPPPAPWPAAQGAMGWERRAALTLATGVTPPDPPPSQDAIARPQS